MKFDYYVLNTYVPEADGEAPELYAKWFEQISLAEELGFEGAWFTEHHFGRFGGMLPSPQMFMAALAQRTTRIRLGTAVVLLTFHHPLRIVEEMAMLDILSNGRLNVGIGRGMGTQPFRIFGTDPAVAQEKLEEQVEMVIRAWTEVPFQWRGKYYDCPDPVLIRPRPVQQPHPPLWMACGSDTTHARWIGRHGLNMMNLPWLQGFEVTRRAMDAWVEGLREGGHDRASHQALSYMPIHVGETEEHGLAVAARHWALFREVSDEERGTPLASPLRFDDLVADNRLIFGDAERCRQHISRLCNELDVDRLALMFHFGGMPQDVTLASVRRFAADVAPAFS